MTVKRPRGRSLKRGSTDPPDRSDLTVSNELPVDLPIGDAELLVLENLDILSGINAQPEQSRTIKPQFRRRGGHEL